jgi:hypothetical protein
MRRSSRTGSSSTREDPLAADAVRVSGRLRLSQAALLRCIDLRATGLIRVQPCYRTAVRRPTTGSRVFCSLGNLPGSSWCGFLKCSYLDECSRPSSCCSGNRGIHWSIFRATPARMRIAVATALRSGRHCDTSTSRPGATSSSPPNSAAISSALSSTATQTDRGTESNHRTRRHQCPVTVISARATPSDLRGPFQVAEGGTEVCHLSWPGGVLGVVCH